jgi:hypothetical protein
VDPGRRLAFAVEALATGQPDPLKTLAHEIESLDVGTVNDAIARHFDPARLDIVAVGGALGPLLRQLGGDEPTPRSHGEEQRSDAMIRIDGLVGEKLLELRLVGDTPVPADAIFR